MSLGSKTEDRRSQMLLWGYGFGAALIGMGLLVLSIALGSALHSATRGIQKLSIPGRRMVTLKEGLYVGLLPAPNNGPALSARDVDVVINSEDGAPVTLVPFPPEAAQANAKIGTSLFQTDIPFDGRYEVQSRAAENAPPAELLLIHESLSRNRSDIAVGVILMAVLGGFGTIVLILTHRRGAAAKAVK